VLASVDVGTNTVRLLVAEVKDGAIEPVRIFRRITRLGGGFNPETGLAPDSAERTLAALSEIAEICRASGVSSIRAVGTAVLRNAPDGIAFAAKVRSETGLPLEIIEGDEEARLTALGVRAAIDPAPEGCLIMDIGGGSTEFVLMRGEDILFSRSYPLGVVSLCESFPDPPHQAQQISKIIAQLSHDLTNEALYGFASDSPVIGTAGTVTTMAALKLNMSPYDASRVNNLQLTRAELEELFFELQALSIEEREERPGMEKGRGDLILPGIQIVRTVLEKFGQNKLTVSDAGLLEGVILRMNPQTT
jgi:exopolyphosphatase / guanosine-5'-triphosphate,3'-diphosphate pyrophosphatase